MKKLTLSLFLLILSSTAIVAQTGATGPAPAAKDAKATASSIPAPPAINAETTPVELARAALAAQGGDKFKNLQNVWIYGDVNLYSPNSSFPQPGKFSLVTAGAKMRLDVDSPAFKFKQIFDGQQSYSSMPGVQTPPAVKFGLFVLTKYDQPGYTVSALANEKKLRAFRIVDPDGNTTDFFIDPVN